MMPPTIVTYNVSAETYTPIPLPVYTICFMAGSRSLDVGLAAIAVAYGANHSLSLI